MLFPLVAGLCKIILQIGGKLILRNVNYVFYVRVSKLKEVLFQLKSLGNKQRSCPTLFKIDNTSAVTSISRMGNLKSIHMDITKDVWNWTIHRDI